MMKNLRNLYTIFGRRQYIPKHVDNKMSDEGDVVNARELFIKNRFRNLDKLLYQRYNWMNDFIPENADLVILEIGCGAGFSPFYLKKKPILTDAANNPWVEKYIDATNIDMPDNSVDVLIASHTMHHFYSPYKFLFEALRTLKPEGVLLIQEINTSILMKLLLCMMAHEGWNYDVDVFDEHSIATDAEDLWSANCAIPELLFEDEKRFLEVFQNQNGRLEIKLNSVNECFLFPLSGGVIAKTKMIALPNSVLNGIIKFDNLLCKVAPSIFALGRSVVLQKI